MAVSRTSRSATQHEEPVAPPEGGAVVVAPPPPAGRAAPPSKPTMGFPCQVGTPGFLMGLPKAPETAAEHAARLGASAGTYRDVGWMLGTLEPRPGWPAPPAEPPPEEPAAP